MIHGSPSPKVAGKILIVDDELDLASGLKMYLRRLKYDVETFPTAETCLERLKNSTADLVITDLNLPGMSGLALLETLRSGWPEIMVVVITGYGTIENAVKAIRMGAFDYQTKPFKPQELEVVVNRVFAHKALSDENRILKRELQAQQAFSRLIGQSEAMKKLQGLITRVGPGDASTLIIGESGTGKELVANAIHLSSRRKEQPFIPVDCAAMPATLMESELFGHEKGAFTGALSAKAGLLEAADGGTLFFDELGELELPLQVKLLRVIQERQFRRLGGSRLISVDVRFVAATNRDLEKEVKAGRFREDLYHRLNVVQLRLPPLRERAGDIALIAYHTLQQQSERIGRHGCRLSPEAVSALEGYSWPGNVRELINAMQYAISMSETEVIGLSDLPPSIQQSALSQGISPSTGVSPVLLPGSGPLKLSSGEVLEVRTDLPYKAAKRHWLEIFEREYFRDLLKRYDYNISHAARSAEIDRKSIQRIMKRGSLEGARGEDDLDDD